MDTLKLMRRKAASDAGAEIIELAIVIPILVILLFGIVDFAFLFQRWEVVTNATREGARLASLRDTTAAGLDYAEADIDARVDAYLDAGGLHGTPTVDPDWTTDDTVGTVTVPTVTVTVTYTSNFIFLPGSIDLTSVSEMRLEGAP